MNNSVIKIIKKKNSSVIIDVNQTNHNLSVGEVVYLSKREDIASGKYLKANASNLSTANAVGFVYEVTDQDNFKLITQGLFQNIIFKPYQIGEMIYLGITDGSVTNLELIYSKPLGIKTKDGLLVNIQRGWINFSNDGTPDNNSFIASSSSSSSEITIEQSSHDLSVGDAVYYSPTGYKKALANETEMVEVVGIVSNVSEDGFRLSTSGLFKTSIFEYAAGTVLFLSGNNLGKLTDIEPFISKPIAIKVEDGIIINIQRGSTSFGDIGGNEGSGGIYKSDDKIGDIKYSADSTPIRTDGYILFKNNQIYAKSQVQPLLDFVSEDFINNYIDETDTDITFKNIENFTDTIYYSESESSTGNLYIKAFSTSTEGTLTGIPVGNVLSALDPMPPEFYMHMDGRLCVISDYPTLASYIYSTYGTYTKFGGDGITTFGLPNLNTSLTDPDNNTVQIYYYIKYR